MDELSITLLDKLIDKTFEDLSSGERLDFLERLFTDMSPESQERFLRRLVRGIRGGRRAAMGVRRSTLIHWLGEEEQPQDIGPWQACCKMMIRIDQAPRLEALDVAEPARIFSALADETRLKIVKVLMAGEQRVDSLTQVLQLPQPTVSHHLRILKEAKLVHNQRRGRSIYYSLAPPLRAA